MNIFNKVTLQSLKKNKVRTIVTIIGVMLSAAMICAVTTTISSFQNYLIMNQIYSKGSWHGWIEDTDSETYEFIVASDEVESVGYASRLGYALQDQSKNDYKPYLYVLGADEPFLNMTPIHLTSGRLPENSTELLLPEHLFENGGIHYKIGDQITLSLGERRVDGDILNQHNPCYTYTDDNEEVLLGEELVVQQTRTYSVVGFYERFPYMLEDFSAPGYTVITRADPVLDASCTYDIFFKMKNPKSVFSFMNENGLMGSTNTDVLLFSGASRYNSFYAMLYSLAAIVIFLIMFGSISLIYNAFSISVSERTRQFGLLSSIGATRKQLRRMVLFEAVAVSAIGIPLGILVGIGGIGITLLFIGNRFASILGNPISMRVCVSPISVLIACMVSLLTVLISAWIPSSRATRVTAIEAIRQQQDIQNLRPVRTSRLAYFLFGLPGVLASKHYKRNRSKYRATVVSLFMSIVLFVSASSFTDYLTESSSGAFQTSEYDLMLSTSDDELGQITREELLSSIKKEESIIDAVYSYWNVYDAVIPQKDLTKDMILFSENLGITQNDSGDSSMNTAVYFVDDEAFFKLLASNHLSADEYMDPSTPKAVVLNSVLFFDSDAGKYQQIQYLKPTTDSLRIGQIKIPDGYYVDNIQEDENGDILYYLVSETNENQVMTLPEEEILIYKDLSIGAMVSEAPFYISLSNMTLACIYPYSMMESVLGFSDPAYYQFLIQAKDHTTGYQQIKKLLTEASIPTGSLYDYGEQAEDDRNLVMILQVFSYGFIVLISLIAAANVFNTISTNISLRRREFAMLKSVGMTKKGLNRMMNYECILYGSRALLWGLPVSLIISYLIYHSFAIGYSLDYHLPWAAIGIATLSVFAVVFVTMMYSMSKIKKENPIDALRNENL